MTAVDLRAQDILDFWYLPAHAPGHGQPRQVWFRKDDAFDAQIRTRFGAVIAQACAGALEHWDNVGPQGCLARILLLDQFTRNAWRGTPAAFSGDTLALAAAGSLVASGADRLLTPLQRRFAYLPFEHAEDAAMQTQSVTLITALAAEHPGFDEALDYAVRHRDVVARFGRFPHRNPILARVSRPEEADYLAQPGSGF